MKRTLWIAFSLIFGLVAASRLPAGDHGHRSSSVQKFSGGNSGGGGMSRQVRSTPNFSGKVQKLQQNVQVAPRQTSKPFNPTIINGNHVTPFKPIKVDPVKPVVGPLKPIKPISPGVNPVVNPIVGPFKPIKPIVPVKDPIKPIKPIGPIVGPIKPILDPIKPIKPIKPFDPIVGPVKPLPLPHPYPPKPLPPICPPYNPPCPPKHNHCHDWWTGCYPWNPGYGGINIGIGGGYGSGYCETVVSNPVVIEVPTPVAAPAVSSPLVAETAAKVEPVAPLVEPEAPAPDAPKLQEVRVGSTIELPGGFGSEQGGVVLKMGDVALGCLVNDWKAEKVQLTLPAMGLLKAKEAELMVVQSDGKIAVTVPVMLLPPMVATELSKNAR
jgi:hypothetical protein